MEDNDGITINCDVTNRFQMRNNAVVSTESTKNLLKVVEKVNCDFENKHFKNVAMGAPCIIKSKQIKQYKRYYTT